MAKKTIGNIFDKTEKEEPAPKAKEIKSSPLSVYLTAEEKIELAGIAEELGETNHSIMQFAVKEFLRRYAAGEYEIKTEKVTRKIIKPL